MIHRGFKTFLAALALTTCLSLAALAAEDITGIVRNQSRGQASAGDEVILLRFRQGMEEVSRTRTDAQGAFTFNGISAFNGTSVTDQYMVRVVHHNVNYDQTVIGRAPLAISVFDSVPRIQGLSGNLGIARMESDGKILKVTEMYAINNASAPPLTQSGPRNFEIFLPPKAVFDSVEARREQGVWVKIAPAPVNGQPGRYAIDFPLRPGDTLIKFTYHLPYSKAASFQLKLSYPIRKFAVMHPPSMVFKALRPGTFTNPGQADGLQIEAAVKPLVGDVPPFEISGVGVAPPPVSAAVPTPAPAVAPAPAAAATRSPATGRASGPNAAPPAGRFRESWVVVLATVGLLIIGAFAFWRIRRTPPAATAGAPPLLDALKEELFQLEVDRAQGTISASDFAAAKQALNQTLKRAMKKGMS
jgi:hypothetical protein